MHIPVLSRIHTSELFITDTVYIQGTVFPIVGPFVL